MDLKISEKRENLIINFLKESIWYKMGIFTDPEYQKLDWQDVAAKFKFMARYDGKISTNLGIRRTAALKYPWQITGGSDLAKKLCAKAVENLYKTDSMRKIWSAIPFGLSFTEIQWAQNENGYWLPSSLNLIPFDKVKFDENGKVVIISDTFALLPEKNFGRKFLLLRHDYEEMEDFGVPLLAAIYWIAKAKKDGLKLWIKLMDKFSIPELITLCETSANRSQVDEQLLNVAQTIAQQRAGGVVALANVKDVKQITVDGQADDFSKFFKFLQDEISFTILGSNLTTSEGNAGSRALGQVHQEVSEVVSQGDAMEIAGCLNRQLFKYIVDINIGDNQEIPSIEFDFDEELTWQMVVDAIKLGIPISKKMLYQKFNFPEPENKNDSFEMRSEVQLSATPFQESNSQKQELLQARRSQELKNLIEM